MAMSYLKVRWKHSFSDEPNLLYSELDDARWELRKVEVFPDGRLGYASSDNSYGGTKLSKEPLPFLRTIASDPQFEPYVISCADFESVWKEATAK